MRVEDFGVMPPMQSKDIRGTFWRLGIILAGVAILGSNLVFFRPDLMLLSPLAFFICALFVTEFFSMPLILGGTVSVSGGVLVAALFLFPLPYVLLITAAGVLAATGLREAKAEEADVFLSLARKIIVIFGAGYVYHVLKGPALLTGTIAPELWLNRGGYQIVAALFTYFAVDYTLDQLLVTVKYKTPLKPAIRGAINYQSLGWVYFGSLPPGVLAALIFKVQEAPLNMVWAGLFFLLFLGLLQYAFFLNLRSTASYPRMLNAVMTAIESQDPLFRGHAERVGELATGTARQMGLYGERLNLIRYAALLHDIGKIYLDKDGAQNIIAGGSEEADLHAIFGAQILQMDPYLKQVAEVVRKHHEPYRLKRRSRDNLPIGARIINVVAAYDVLTHVGPLEGRFTAKQALSKLKVDNGRTYDPRVVRAFERVLKHRDFLF